MVILSFYLERNVLCQLIHSVQLTQQIASNYSDYWLFSLFLHTFRLKKFGKCNAQKISPIFPPYREQVTGG